MKFVIFAVAFTRLIFAATYADCASDLVKVGAEINHYQLGGAERYPNSSWSLKEKINPEKVHKSNDCTDFFKNYKKYLTLLSRNGFDTCTITVEWSDLQPNSPDLFNEKSIKSLVELLQCAKRLKLDATISLIDGTTPIWFEKMGGFSNAKSIPYFINFVERVIAETSAYSKEYVLFKKCSSWVYDLTSNNSYATFCDEYSKHIKVIVDAQIEAYKIIKKTDPSIRVGIGFKQSMPAAPEPFFELPLTSMLSKNYWKNDFFFNLIVKDKLSVILPFWVYMNEDLSNKAPWYDFIAYHYEFNDQYLVETQCEYILNQVKVLDKEVSLYLKCSNRNPDQHMQYFEAIESMIDSFEKENLAVKGVTFQSLVDCYEWKHGYSDSYGLFRIEKDLFTFHTYPGTQRLILYMAMKKTLRELNSGKAIDYDYESVFKR